MPKVLMNAAAERAVLSGICHYGAEAYLDIEELVEIESFVLEEDEDKELDDYNPFDINDSDDENSDSLDDPDVKKPEINIDDI